MYLLFHTVMESDQLIESIIPPPFNSHLKCKLLCCIEEEKFSSHKGSPKANRNLYSKINTCPEIITVLM